MKYLIFFTIALSALWQNPSVFAGNDEELNVLACEPEWAALVYALGDDSFNIYSATTYQQDPHHIQARPSLIAKARKADLVICSGADLEAGWLPLLLRKSSNPDIQPGATGYFMAADHVNLLNKSSRADRSEGDVHGKGNPHVHLDPHRMIILAQRLSKRLMLLAPEKKSVIGQNMNIFESGMRSMLKDIESDLVKIQGQSFVIQHDSWAYLFEWLKVRKVAELEPKPGLPPTTSHLVSLLDKVNKETANLIVYSSYQDDKAVKWMSSKTGIPNVQLPYSIEKWNDKAALQNFYREIAVMINQSLNESGKYQWIYHCL